jgi:hypothetical protein
MNYEDQLYHRDREQHCRTMAEVASDPDIRRRHRELAELHAGRAARYRGMADPSGGLSAG